MSAGCPLHPAAVCLICRRPSTPACAECSAPAGEPCDATCSALASDDPTPVRVRIVVVSSPAGDLCVPLCRTCRGGGPALRLTLDAVARLAAEHAGHIAARDAEAAAWTADDGGSA